MEKGHKALARGSEKWQETVATTVRIKSQWKIRATIQNHATSLGMTPSSKLIISTQKRNLDIAPQFSNLLGSDCIQVKYYDIQGMHSTTII